MEAKKTILIERGDHLYEVIDGMPEIRTEVWFKEKLKKNLIKAEGWKKIQLANGQTFEGFFYERTEENQIIF